MIAVCRDVHREIHRFRRYVEKDVRVEVGYHSSSRKETSSAFRRAPAAHCCIDNGRALVLKYDVQRVDDAWDVAENCELQLADAARCVHIRIARTRKQDVDE